MKSPFILLALLFLPACDLDRSLAFQQKIQEGRPLVLAIEKFRKDTGAYPASLAELAPKYLPALPPNIGDSPHEYHHWTYYPLTNDTSVSYSLYYYMGKGGIAYSPPYWTGDNDGHKRVFSIA